MDYWFLYISSYLFLLHFALCRISVGVKGLTFVPFDLYLRIERPLPGRCSLLQLFILYGDLLAELWSLVKLDLRMIDLGVCGESNSCRQLSLYSSRRGDAAATLGLVIGERVRMCLEGGEVHIDSGDIEKDILE